MLDWRKRRISMAHNQPVAGEEPVKRQGRVMSGKYRSLYKYLEGRYANTVVLTFAQIEDLLGFTLPDLARFQREWWANAGENGTPSGPSRAWTEARRTATPNLLARTV